MNTQKDFEATAAIIRAELEASVKGLHSYDFVKAGEYEQPPSRAYFRGKIAQTCTFCAIMGELYAKDNARFDYVRFKAACGITAEIEAII